MTEGETSKRKPIYKSKLLWVLVLFGGLWSGLWLVGKNLIINQLRLAVVEVETDTGAFGDTVAISGFPLGYRLKLIDYDLDLEALLGEALKIRGDDAILIWRVWTPRHVRLEIDGLHDVRFDRDHFEIRAKSGDNFGVFGVGSSGLQSLDFKFTDVIIEDVAGNVFADVIAAQEALISLHRVGRRNNDLNISAEWASLTTPPLPPDLVFLGRDIKNGRITGYVKHFGQAIERGGFFACDLNHVGGEVSIDALRFDWGDLKPRFNIELKAGRDGLDGIIGILFEDTNTLFDTVITIVGQPAQNSDILASIKPLLVNAEVNSAAFPVPIINGVIGLPSMGGMPLFPCA